MPSDPYWDPIHAALHEDGPDMDGCPECGAVYIIDHRWIAESTDGPLEMVRAHCTRGHWHACSINDLEGARARLAP